MLFDLPDNKTLYAAFLARDQSYTGLVYVGITNTGVFCCLSCPGTKPKLSSCVFFSTLVDCLDAGFRPCLRCHPLTPATAAEPAVQHLLDALEQAPSKCWREQHIKHMGLDPATVRRVFKRHFGITFLDMARMRRRSNEIKQLDSGAVDIAARQVAGFRSGGGFRTAMSRLLGRSPAMHRDSTDLATDWIDTPLGAMIVVTDVHSLYLLEFFDRKGLPGELQRLQARRGLISLGRHTITDQIEAELRDYFAGIHARYVDGFKTPLALHGSEFTLQAWDALQTIPPGETRSYQFLARVLGRPGASRAVARANGANPLAIVVPCHRLIGVDGSLTGYGGGLWRKQWLIEHECQYAKAATESQL